MFQEPCLGSGGQSPASHRGNCGSIPVSPYAICDGQSGTETAPIPSVSVVHQSGSFIRYFTLILILLLSDEWAKLQTLCKGTPFGKRSSYVLPLLFCCQMVKGISVGGQQKDRRRQGEHRLQCVRKVSVHLGVCVAISRRPIVGP
jgi:hypothetical protein